MSTKLDPIIFGDKKNIDFDKFNIGSLTKAITFDLEEFGKKGVQGLPIKANEVNALIKYESAAKRAKEPYIQAGVVKKDLVLVVRDKKNDKFEAMTMVVKGYADIRGELAANTAAVVNLAEGDATIDPAAANQAARFGTAAMGEDDADFGGITGNVVLCAHGTPKVLPGKVIGTELGEKTPEEIVKLLIGNSDKAKRIGKDYNGSITLSGCFTASGGPEADKQDDPFAKKVHDLLKSKGYTKLNVVGMPGPSWTSGGTLKDDTFGKTVPQGEKGVWPTMSDTTEGAQAVRLQIDKLTDGLIAAAKKAPDPKNFLATAGAKAVLVKIQSLEKDLASIQSRLNAKGIGKDVGGLKGTFGLRLISAQLGASV
jgi:hypothetical protein